MKREKRVPVRFLRNTRRGFAKGKVEVFMESSAPKHVDSGDAEYLPRWERWHHVIRDHIRRFPQRRGPAIRRAGKWALGIVAAIIVAVASTLIVRWFT